MLMREKFDSKLIGPLLLFLLLIFVVLFYGSATLGASVVDTSLTRVDTTIFTILGVLALLGFMVLIFGSKASDI